MELTRRHLLKGAAALGAAGAVPATLARPRHRPDDPEEGAGLGAGRRYLEVRPALQHLLERHPRLLQYLRQPDQPAPRRQALPRPRHRVEARGPDHVALQAAPGRQVPQWRPVHLGRRQVEHRAHLRSRREDHGGHRLHHHRPDRGAGCHDARDPHEEARSAPARRGSRSTAARSCRRSTWKSAGNDGFNAKPVGTGPIRFVSWVKDDKAVFDANPDYWGGKIDVDRWIMRRDPRDGAARGRACSRARWTSSPSFRPTRASASTRNASTKVQGALYAGLYVLAVNSKRPPLDNPLVKQALSLAIDREAIVKELWRGRGIVPNRPHREGRQPLRREPAAARLQPEGGARAAQEGGLQGRGDRHRDHRGLRGPGQGRCPRPSPPMWKDVGVNAKVEVIEYSVRAQKNREKSFKGLWWSDPTSTLARSRRHDVAAPRAGRASGLLARGRSSTSSATPRASSVDEKFRGEAYKKMTKIFLEQPAVAARHPAVRGLRRAEVRRVDAEPEPAVRGPQVQPEAPPRVDACGGAAARSGPRAAVDPCAASCPFSPTGSSAR